MYESDDGGAVFHRAGFARDFSTCSANAFAGGVGIVDGEGNVAKSGADFVGCHAPIVGEFNFCMPRILAIAKESEGKFAIGKVFALAQLHAEDIAIKRDAALEIADPQHGVNEVHGRQYTQGFETG